MFSLNYNTADPTKPSFFEMYAQSELASKIKPAMSYIFSVFALRNQALMTPLNYFDEIYHSIQFLVERFYLKNYDASFSENFFSLRRVGSSVGANKQAKTPVSLTKAQRWRSLAFLVLVPYIKAKLDGLYKKISGRNEEDFIIQNEFEQERTGFSRILHKFIIHFYPYFNFIYEGVLLIYQVAYMHDYSNYYDWFLHLQSIDVKRMMFSEYIAQLETVKAKRKKMIELLRSKRFGLILQLIYRFYNFIFDYAPYIVPLLILAFKVAQWWYSESGNAGPAKQVPPPPQPPDVTNGEISLPANRRICPICEDVRSNAAVLSSSGFVFCYPCIHSYVSEHSRCPVTSLPSSVDHIRKIYEST